MSLINGVCLVIYINLSFDQLFCDVLVSNPTYLVLIYTRTVKANHVELGAAKYEDSQTKFIIHLQARLFCQQLHNIHKEMMSL